MPLAVMHNCVSGENSRFASVCSRSKERGSCPRAGGRLSGQAFVLQAAGAAPGHAAGFPGGRAGEGS